jgi:hypothetical protein
MALRPRILIATQLVRLTGALALVLYTVVHSASAQVTATTAVGSSIAMPAVTINPTANGTASKTNTTVLTQGATGLDFFLNAANPGSCFGNVIVNGLNSSGLCT